MPYRRLPKSDAARLKALRTLLENNDIYTARNRFIDWKTLNRAQPIYDRLLTATEQLRMSRLAQGRFTTRMGKLYHNAMMYVSHFIQVLLMCVERGEIKRQQLELYGLPQDTTAVPYLNSYDNLLEWGKKIVEGEKARIKHGGRPIYNPSIGMVGTHYDIFADAYRQQQTLQERTSRDMRKVEGIRPEADEVIQELWNQVEANFAKDPPEKRLEECRRFGVIYYYRSGEKH